MQSKMQLVTPATFENSLAYFDSILVRFNAMTIISLICSRTSSFKGLKINKRASELNNTKIKLCYVWIQGFHLKFWNWIKMVAIGNQEFEMLNLAQIL